MKITGKAQSFPSDRFSSKSQTGPSHKYYIYILHLVGSLSLGACQMPVCYTQPKSKLLPKLLAIASLPLCRSNNFNLTSYIFGPKSSNLLIKSDYLLSIIIPLFIVYFYQLSPCHLSDS